MPRIAPTHARAASTAASLCEASSAPSASARPRTQLAKVAPTSLRRGASAGTSSGLGSSGSGASTTWGRGAVAAGMGVVPSSSCGRWRTGRPLATGSCAAVCSSSASVVAASSGTPSVLSLGADWPSACSVGFSAMASGAFSPSGGSSSVSMCSCASDAVLSSIWAWGSEPSIGCSSVLSSSSAMPASLAERSHAPLSWQMWRAGACASRAPCRCMLAKCARRSPCQPVTTIAEYSY